MMHGKIEAGDIDGAEQEAKDWELNSNISTGMSDVEQIQQSQYVNSFDAVALIKAKLDTKDPYLTYCISIGAMSNSSDYVFESTCKGAEVALLMDVDANPPNAWQTQNAYFDATHRSTWIQNISTLHLPPSNVQNNLVGRLGNKD